MLPSGLYLKLRRAQPPKRDYLGLISTIEIHKSNMRTLVPSHAIITALQTTAKSRRHVGFVFTIGIQKINLCTPIPNHAIITAPQTIAESRRLDSKYPKTAPSECTRRQGSHPRHNRPYPDVDPSPENHRQRYSGGSVANPPRGLGGVCEDLRVLLVVPCLDHHEHLVNVFQSICAAMEPCVRGEHARARHEGVKTFHGSFLLILRKKRHGGGCYRSSFCGRRRQ